MNSDGYPTCARCGESGPGRERWMFYRGRLVFSRDDLPIRSEYFCNRCLRRHRLHAGLAIGVFVAALIAVLVAVVLLNAGL